MSSNDILDIGGEEDFLSFSDHTILRTIEVASSSCSLSFCSCSD